MDIRYTKNSYYGSAYFDYSQFFEVKSIFAKKITGRKVAYGVFCSKNFVFKKYNGRNNDSKKSDFYEALLSQDQDSQGQDLIQEFREVDLRPLEKRPEYLEEFVFGNGTVDVTGRVAKMSYYFNVKFVEGSRADWSADGQRIIDEIMWEMV